MRPSQKPFSSRYFIAVLPFLDAVLGQARPLEQPLFVFVSLTKIHPHTAISAGKCLGGGHIAIR